MKKLPHISGDFYLLPVIDGGRSSPVSMGYRPMSLFGDAPTSVSIVGLEQKEIVPGELVGRVGLHFLKPNLVIDHLEEGMVFFLYEGNIKVASFEVKSIFEERI